MFNTVNKETVAAYGKRCATVAIGAGAEMGTIEDTINAYRENLIDTLNDEGLGPWVWVAVDAYNVAIAD